MGNLAPRRIGQSIVVLLFTSCGESNQEGKPPTWRPFRVSRPLDILIYDRADTVVQCVSKMRRDFSGRACLTRLKSVRGAPP